MHPIQLAQIFVCAFFAACFIQSGFDKVFDWKGNYAWLEGHFSKTFLARLVKPMLAFITLVEISTGLTCAAAIMVLATAGERHPGQPAAINDLPVMGLSLSCLALVMLFAGQRIAKDYVGAATLASYFAVALLGLLIVAM